MTNFEVLRLDSASEFNYPIAGIPTPDEVTIAEAYWCLKESLSDSDDDALVFLTITTSPDAQGFISDDGSGDGTGLLKFVVDESALVGLNPVRTYFRSIKVRLSNDRFSAPRDADAPVRILASGIAKATV